jgi:hypothetical protein
VNKKNIALAFAAGLVGGVISTYVSPRLAYAQSQPPSEIRAQSFSLVNQEGVTMGNFSFDTEGRPKLLLRDQHGHEVWSVVGEHHWNHSRDGK